MRYCPPSFDGRENPMAKARDIYKGKSSFSSGKCLVCRKNATVIVCNRCNEVGCIYCLGGGGAGTRCRTCKSGSYKNISFQLIRS